MSTALSRSKKITVRFLASVGASYIALIGAMVGYRIWAHKKMEQARGHAAS